MKEKKTGDYVGAIVGNLIALVFMNTVLLWRQYTQGVILESWVNILWAVNVSLLAQMVGNLILCFYRPSWFSALMRSAFAATGLMSAIVFFMVFPLDFSQLVGMWLNTAVRVLVIMGMAGAAIGFLVELVRYIREACRPPVREA
ncbi:MAG TPA: hypothetical protein VL354_08320 [Spirochaetia bacterium]|nr:hypothetical protein [Spirochaetia bacterium]